MTELKLNSRDRYAFVRMHCIDPLNKEVREWQVISSWNQEEVEKVIGAATTRSGILEKVKAKAAKDIKKERW